MYIYTYFECSPSVGNDRSWATSALWMRGSSDWQQTLLRMPWNSWARNSRAIFRSVSVLSSATSACPCRSSRRGRDRWCSALGSRLPHNLRGSVSFGCSWAKLEGHYYGQTSVFPSVLSPIMTCCPVSKLPVYVPLLWQSKSYISHICFPFSPYQEVIALTDISRRHFAFCSPWCLRQAKGVSLQDVFSWNESLIEFISLLFIQLGMYFMLFLYVFAGVEDCPCLFYQEYYRM